MLEKKLIYMVYIYVWMYEVKVYLVLLLMIKWLFKGYNFGIGYL